MASKKKKIPKVNFPPRTSASSMVRPVLSITITQKQHEHVEEDDDPLVDEPDQFLDPAQEVLLAASESKLRRKKEETRLELEKIQERIEYALTEYQLGEGVREGEKKSEVDLRTIESPHELYKMLGDARLRAKYQRRVTVVLVGLEEALEDRERLLQSLHEFFQETRAGNTDQVLDDVASEEIDFNEATAGLESALLTAQSAASRLLEIKKDMGQLFSIVQTYPDTKKGRKKLEKALMKAQEEVEDLKTQLQGVGGELESSKEKCSKLQKQVDAKSTECERLRKMSGQIEQLQQVNTGLTSELSSLKETLERTQAELDRERQGRLLAKVQPAKEVVKVDESKVKELEAALAAERDSRTQLEAELAAREDEFRKEKEALVTEHEAEVQEMRGRYEEQMKSLMVDDVFSEVGSQVEVRGGEGEEVGGSDVEGAEGEREGEGVDEVDTADALGDEALQQEGRPTGLASKSFAERLKKEYQLREKKLQEEMTEVKNKSRKTITSLKAQLMEVESKHSDQLSTLQKEVEELTRQSESLDRERNELSEMASSLREEKASLEAQLQEVVGREKEKEGRILELEQELEETAAAKLEEVAPEKAVRLLQLVNRSAQWSEVLPQSGLITPGSLEATSTHLPSYPLPPMVPMDEVHHGSAASSLQLDSQTFHKGTPFLPGSFNQSVVSLEPPLGSPLGSPLQANAPPTGPAHPPDGLRMLAQSRMSHHSPPSAGLSPDHPIINEWTKAYDLVMKFRNNVADMLSEDERFENEVEDLRSVEAHTLDRDQDLQGEITHMRFSLTLLLHQMEHTLQETFAKMAEGGEEGEGGGDVTVGIGEGGEDGEEGEVKKLQSTVAHLRRKLRQSVDTHKMELQESKETIANLSSKVETLKMEVASLRHTMASQPSGDPQDPVMFTRLDYEHNDRQLQSAVAAERLSPTAYHEVTENMQQYISIPGQRLAHFGKRRRQQEEAKKLLQEVQREYGNRSRAERVAREIGSLEERRQQRFEQKMEQLREKRTVLAQSLNNKLGGVEKKTRTFLIKPIFCSKRKSKVHPDLITPLPRPLPVQPPSRPKTVVGTRHSLAGESRGHPSMRLVNGLVRSRHEALREELAGNDSTRMSCLATPLPHPQAYRETTRGITRKREEEEEQEGEWQVDTSRPPTQLEGPFSPLMFQAPPTIPKLVELDITRKRHPAALLGHLLPGRQFTSHSPTPTHTPRLHSRHGLSKLASHSVTEDTSHLHPLPLPLPSSTLPPIHVPSRLDGPLTVT